MIQDVKALLACGNDVQNAELRHVPMNNIRHTADRKWHSRRADFVTFFNAADAERRVVAQAVFPHGQIALLEQFELQ